MSKRVVLKSFLLNFMKREELIKDLKQFGLTEYEAKAYLSLAMHGPLQASALSTLSKVPQSKIYEVLKTLVSKSLAEFWNGRPIRYRAVEPAIALNKLIDNKVNAVNGLKEISNVLVGKLKTNNDEKYGLWSSSGKELFLQKAAEIVSKSKKFGFATTSRFSRYPSLDQAYKKALKRGVKIKMIGTNDLDENQLARASWYAKQGAKIKIVPMDIHPIIGLVDNKEVSVRVDNTTDPDFFWSNNPSLINIFGIYFKELWNRGNNFKP